MYRYLYLLVSFLCSYTVLSAQDMLTFPDASPNELRDLSLQTCVHESTAMLENLDLSDYSKAEDLHAYGMRLLNLGQHEYAKEVFEKALEINRKAYGTADVRYADALLDLARAYMLLIRYNEAAGLYEEALATVKQVEGTNSQKYLEVLNECGFVYTRIKDWQKGIYTYLEGLKVIEKQGKQKHLHHAILQLNLGVCYKGMYDFPKAIEAFEKALAIGKNDQRLPISAAGNLAEAYAYMGQADKAKALLSKHEPAAMKMLTAKNLEYARVWLQYGAAYTALKEFDAAKRMFKQAFVSNSLTYTEVDDIPDQANDLMFNNQYLATCGQAGIMMYSIELYKQIYETTGDVQALKDGYKIVQAMGKYGEKLMNSYLSEANKLILFRLGAAILFDRSIYYSYELYQHTKEEKYIEDAFFYSERSKSTLLTNALRSKENIALVDPPEELIKEGKALKQELKDLQRQQLEAVSETQRTAIQRNINKVNIRIEQFKEGLRKRYPDYHQHNFNTKLTNLAEVQAFLKNNDNVLIEYALGLEKHYVFLVSATDLKMVQLDLNMMEVKQQTINFRKSLTDYRFIRKEEAEADSLFVEDAQYFYKKFLAPVINEVPVGKHIVIVPDQSLGHLPFETFLTEAPAQRLDYANYPYLIKKHPITYSYSATILLAQEREQERREIPEKGVLAFAAEYADQNATDISYQRSGTLGALREGLQPLPGAKKEVATMEKYLYGSFYNGETASEAHFKENAHKYGIIHLAMHGILDPRSPILSSLVFSEDSSTVEDNFLRAYEIAQLDLNADLVVLSACETGYGKFQQGEGVMSLAHSFSYAGASSVLMSLWQVNDASTSQIMKDYYVNLAKGYSKEKALQNAKLDYLSNSELAAAQHPAYWAAFVQTGDVRPLALVAKTGKTFQQMHLIVSGVVLLLIVGLIWGVMSWRKHQYA